MMPKVFAQWTGRIWAALTVFTFMVIVGNLLEVAAPVLGTVLISALMTTFFAGLIAQRMPAIRAKTSDLIYRWRTR